MEKILKRIGIDSSYLNKIAEGNILLEASDDWYFTEDDVLTEVVYEQLSWLISHPEEFDDAKKKTVRLLDFLIKNNFVYVGLTAGWFLLKNDKIEEQYLRINKCGIKKFFEKILKIIKNPVYSHKKIAKKIQNLPTYVDLNEGNAKQKTKRDEYWEKFLAQSGNNEHVNLSKLGDAVWKGLSDGIEIEEINKENRVPETKSKKQFVVKVLIPNDFSKDKSRKDVFTNGDLEVFFDGLKVRVKVLKDKDYIKNNYPALYAYTVHHCFLDEVRNTKKDIKVKKSKKYFNVKLKDEAETKTIKFEKNSLVDLKIGFIQLAFLDEFRTCDKGQFTILTMLQKLLPIQKDNRKCEILYET